MKVVIFRFWSKNGRKKAKWFPNAIIIKKLALLLTLLGEFCELLVETLGLDTSMDAFAKGEKVF